MNAAMSLVVFKASFLSLDIVDQSRTDDILTAMVQRNLQFAGVTALPGVLAR